MLSSDRDIVARLAEWYKQEVGPRLPAHERIKFLYLLEASPHFSAGYAQRESSPRNVRIRHLLLPADQKTMSPHLVL
jgi:hypothetical protein